MPAPRGDLRGLRLGAVVGLVALAALFAPAFLRLTTDAAHVPATPVPPALPRLTERLVFVVVDALRHDYAVDPELAPQFARSMQEHSSGVVWAGRITMTSAAALSFGTGTRGTFSQVVLNLDAQRTTANHLFENARTAGLSTGLIGDPVWAQGFGDFDVMHLSEEHLALDHDDTPALLQAAERLVDDGGLPDVTVLHFFASDHMGHAHGVYSPAFREFFQRLDAGLHRLLAKLPPDTTVVVLSDHGALDNGDHGVDSELERKSPFFAYGPGIRPGQRLEIDQVDWAPTLAALLGVASPAQGQGAPAAELLDLDPAAMARLSCAEAVRLTALAKAAGPELEGSAAALAACRSVETAPGAATERARELARAWDEHAEASLSSASLRGALWVLGVLGMLGAAVGLLWGARRRAVVLAALLFVGLATAAVGLTLLTERVWGPGRAAVTWLGTATVAATLLAPRTLERLLGRGARVVGAVALGLVLVSYPIETQLHGGLLTAACLTAAALRARRAWRLDLATGAALVAAAAGGVVLFRLATASEDPLLAWVAGREAPITACLVVAWLAAAAVTTRGAGAAPRGSSGALLCELALAGAVASSALVPRALVPGALGLGALLGLPALAVVSLRRGHVLLARACLFAAAGLLSRPVELPALVAAALFAEIVGHFAARSRRTPAESPLRDEVWLGAVATFALAYAVRVGAQRGLDFATMDWTAGSFDDRVVSHARVGVCLVAKYALACALPGFVLLSRLATPVRRAVLAVLAAGLLLRFGAMVTLLLAPHVGFWPRFRMVGELGPDAIMAAVALGLALFLPRGDHVPAARPSAPAPSQASA